MPSRLGGSEILMTEAELRARIRKLMASGALPNDPPSIERRGSEDLETRFAAPHPCSICLDLRPEVALFYPAGRAVHLHAAGESLWQQEWQA